MNTALAEAIQAKGVRLSFLAERAGISPSHLTRALKLQRPINRQAVSAIAEILNIDVEDVYDGQRLREPTENCPQPTHSQAKASSSTPADVQGGEAGTPSESALSAKQRRKAVA